MKNKILLILLMGILATSLCGCVYSSTTVVIDEYGSGKVSSENGFSKEICEQIGKTPKDFLYKGCEYYTIKHDDIEYLTTIFEDEYLNPEEINWTSVGSISEEFGPIDFKAIDDGFKLNVKFWDTIGSEMEAEHTLPNDIKNITDESLKGMTLHDLLAQDVDGLFLELKFEMPYNVTQTVGEIGGITIDGKNITLNYLEMIKSGGHEWEFKILKTIKEIDFKDTVKGSWYSKAVNSVVNGGLMIGYDDKTFHPNGTLTYAELCKIINKGLSAKTKSNSKYWAKDFILYVQEQGYTLNKSEPTKENWNRPVTREEAAYAITLALNKQMGYNKIEEGDIKDCNEIDPDMQEIILWAYTVGIVKGDPDGKFNPKGNLARAELCQMLYNVHWTVPKKAPSYITIQD